MLFELSLLTSPGRLWLLAVAVFFVQLESRADDSADSAAKVSVAEVESLLEGLRSSRAAVRESASRNLFALGPAAEKAVANCLTRNNLRLEVRSRLQWILDDWAMGLDDEVPVAVRSASRQWVMSRLEPGNGQKIASAFATVYRHDPVLALRNLETIDNADLRADRLSVALARPEDRMWTQPVAVWMSSHADLLTKVLQSNDTVQPASPAAEGGWLSRRLIAAATTDQAVWDLVWQRIGSLPATERWGLYQRWIGLSARRGPGRGREVSFLGRLSIGESRDWIESMRRSADQKWILPKLASLAMVQPSVARRAGEDGWIAMWLQHVPTGGPWTHRFRQVLPIYLRHADDATLDAIATAAGTEFAQIIERLVELGRDDDPQAAKSARGWLSRWQDQPRNAEAVLVAELKRLDRVKGDDPGKVEMVLRALDAAAKDDATLSPDTLRLLTERRGLRQRDKPPIQIDPTTLRFLMRRIDQSADEDHLRMLSTFLRCRSMFVAAIRQSTDWTLAAMFDTVERALQQQTRVGGRRQGFAMASIGVIDNGLRMINRDLSGDIRDKVVAAMRAMIWSASPDGAPSLASRLAVLERVMSADIAMAVESPKNIVDSQKPNGALGSNGNPRKPTSQPVMRGQAEWFVSSIESLPVEEQGAYWATVATGQITMESMPETASKRLFRWIDRLVSVSHDSSGDVNVPPDLRPLVQRWVPELFGDPALIKRWIDDRSFASVLSMLESAPEEVLALAINTPTFVAEVVQGGHADWWRVQAERCLADSLGRQLFWQRLRIDALGPSGLIALGPWLWDRLNQTPNESPNEPAAKNFFTSVMDFQRGKWLTQWLLHPEAVDALGRHLRLDRDATIARMIDLSGGQMVRLLETFLGTAAGQAWLDGQTAEQFLTLLLSAETSDPSTHWLTLLRHRRVVDKFRDDKDPDRVIDALIRQSDAAGGVDAGGVGAGGDGNVPGGQPVDAITRVLSDRSTLERLIEISPPEKLKRWAASRTRLDGGQTASVIYRNPSVFVEQLLSTDVDSLVGLIGSMQGNALFEAVTTLLGRPDQTRRLSPEQIRSLVRQIASRRGLFDRRTFYQKALRNPVVLRHLSAPEIGRYYDAWVKIIQRSEDGSPEAVDRNRSAVAAMLGGPAGRISGGPSIDQVVGGVGRIAEANQLAMRYRVWQRFDDPQRWRTLSDATRRFVVDAVLVDSRGGNGAGDGAGENRRGTRQRSEPRSRRIRRIRRPWWPRILRQQGFETFLSHWDRDGSGPRGNAQRQSFSTELFVELVRSSNLQKMLQRIAPELREQLWSVGLMELQIADLTDPPMHSDQWNAFLTAGQKFPPPGHYHSVLTRPAMHNAVLAAGWMDQYNAMLAATADPARKQSRRRSPVWTGHQVRFDDAAYRAIVAGDTDALLKTLDRKESRRGDAANRLARTLSTVPDRDLATEFINEIRDRPNNEISQIEVLATAYGLWMGRPEDRIEDGVNESSRAMAAVTWTDRFHWGFFPNAVSIASHDWAAAAERFERAVITAPRGLDKLDAATAKWSIQLRRRLTQGALDDLSERSDPQTHEPQTHEPQTHRPAGLSEWIDDSYQSLPKNDSAPINHARDHLYALAKIAIGDVDAAAAMMDVDAATTFGPLWPVHQHYHGMFGQKPLPMPPSKADDYRPGHWQRFADRVDQDRKSCRLVPLSLHAPIDRWIVTMIRLRQIGHDHQAIELSRQIQGWTESMIEPPPADSATTGGNIAPSFDRTDALAIATAIIVWRVASDRGEQNLADAAAAVITRAAHENPYLMLTPMLTTEHSPQTSGSMQNYTELFTALTWGLSPQDTLAMDVQFRQSLRQARHTAAARLVSIGQTGQFRILDEDWKFDKPAFAPEVTKLAELVDRSVVRFGSPAVWAQRTGWRLAMGLPAENAVDAALEARVDFTTFHRNDPITLMLLSADRMRRGNSDGAQNLIVAVTRRWPQRIDAMWLSGRIDSDESRQRTAMLLAVGGDQRLHLSDWMRIVGDDAAATQTLQNVRQSELPGSVASRVAVRRLINRAGIDSTVPIAYADDLKRDRAIRAMLTMHHQTDLAWFNATVRPLAQSQNTIPAPATMR